VERSTVDHEQGELESARLAIIALLAVITDEQFRSVEIALEALGSMSETVAAALEELRLARRPRRSGWGGDHATRRAIEARLAMREERS
jgi:hypothetical protein